MSFSDHDRGQLPVVVTLDVLLQEPETTNSDEQTSHSGGHADSTSLRNPQQIPLTSLDIVKNHVPGVKRSRDVVIEEMEGMVINGLANLVSDAHVASI
jgi:hypothetical protein